MYPLDVGEISRNGLITTELDTGSLRQGGGIFTPKVFRFVVDRKVSGSDVSKLCHLECRWTEGPKQVCALAWWTRTSEFMLPQCKRLISIALPIVGCWKGLCRSFSIQQPRLRWDLSANWTQPWCWCKRCFYMWRGPTGCGWYCC